MKKILISIAAVALLAGCSGSSKQNDGAVADPAGDGVVETVDSAGLSAVIEVMKDGELKTRDDRVAIIDFNATWCPPCRQFGPVFHAVAEKYRDRADFYSVDVDRCPQAAQDFGVQSIPQVSVVHPDGRVDTYVGYMDEARFDSLVASSLK